MENEFPPNSHSRREDRPDPRVEKTSARTDVRQVTRSKATLRKKPLRRKFLEAFRPEDGSGFFEHTLLEVLVPSIKDAIAFTSTEFIETALGTNARPRSRRGGGGYTSYNRMSNSRGRGRRDRDDRDDDRRPRGRERESLSRRSSDIPEVIVDTKAEANEVVDSLFELISMYKVATMRDLLSLIGEPHNPVDEDWGWEDIRGTRIHRVGGGFLIDLPRPEPLD